MFFGRPHRHPATVFIILAVLAGCTTDPGKNHPPLVLAGADQTVNGGDSVNISGVLSTDTDDDELSFTWRQLSGSVVTAVPPWTMNNVTMRFQAPGGFGEQTLTFELKGSDGKLSGFDSVNVLVHNPPPPPADPCQDPNAPTVDVTFSVTFPSGNPARYVSFDGFICGGSTPWAQYLEIWNGGVTTYSRTGPVRVNSPNGSAPHTIRAYWWDTGYSDYAQSSGWITPGQFTMSGVALSQETAPRPGYAGVVPCSPVKTAICDPAPFQKFWVDSNGVVSP